MMAGKGEMDILIKSLGKAAVVVSKGVVLVSAVIPVVLATLDVKNKIDSIKEKEGYVEIPELLFSKSRINIEEATRALEVAHFKVAKTIAKPNIRYRKCKDSDVVRMNRRAMQNVKKGTTITLTYVTSEVIAESAELYEELKERRADAKDKRRRKLKHHTDRVISKIRKRSDTVDLDTNNNGT